MESLLGHFLFRLAQLYLRSFVTRVGTFCQVGATLVPQRLKLRAYLPSAWVARPVHQVGATQDLGDHGVSD